MKSKPFIGIAPQLNRSPSNKIFSGAYETYLDAVSNAGGLGVVLHANTSLIKHYTSVLDGLLLAGGDDIDPLFFGEKRKRNAKLVLENPRRTNFETKLLKAFLRTQKPFLGVCLGAQTLAVLYGGSLYQDLPLEKDNAKDHRKPHRVFIQKPSRLFEILHTDRIQTNSRHHQAIRTIPKALRINAMASDGVLEGVEVIHHPFALAVQWHPEEMPKAKSSQRLIRAFVEACCK